MTQINVELSEMCSAMTIGPIIVPEKLGANDMMQLCHKFGGNMFVIKDESTRETAVDVKQFQNKCNNPWGNFKSKWNNSNTNLYRN